MDLPALDYAEARELMVDGQIRPNKVNDPRIIAAMRLLPRERFVPAHLALFAYVDEDLALGGGRVLMEALIQARLIQTLKPRAGQTALVVGAGTGYAAAILARCGVRVTALEEDHALLALARTALDGFKGGEVTLQSGPLSAGWREAAPYDLVMIEGAVTEIPPAIVAQLRDDGRLVTVLARVGNASQAVLAEKVPGGLRTRPEFDCATPVLRALAPRPAFVF